MLDSVSPLGEVEMICFFGEGKMLDPVSFIGVDEILDSVCFFEDGARTVAACLVSLDPVCIIEDVAISHLGSLTGDTSFGDVKKLDPFCLFDAADMVDPVCLIGDVKTWDSACFFTDSRTLDSDCLPDIVDLVDSLLFDDDDEWLDATGCKEDTEMAGFDCSELIAFWNFEMLTSDCPCVILAGWYFEVVVFGDVKTIDPLRFLGVEALMDPKFILEGVESHD